MCNTRNTRIIFMSNLLEQASLVMIPSGYKEDVVYSEIPINGAGDLSFTRASNGTRINSQGLVEVVPWNLIEQSETLNVSPWVPYALGTASVPVITANDTTAPNGTMTADKVVFDTGAGTSPSDRSVVLQDIFTQPIGIYTASIYAKVASGTAKIIMRCAGGAAYTTLNLTTEWQRFEVAETNIAFGTISIEFGLRRGLVNEPLTSPVTCFIWGAQVNIGSTAKPYFPTTDRLNVPRLTYQNGGGGCPSLLLEKQSTNLALESNTLSTSPNIAEGSTATANVYVSPDGTQNAMRFTETTINDIHGFYQYNTVSAQTYTASVWTKQTGRRYISFYSDFTGSATSSFFDLQTISVVSSGSGHTCSIQDFGNGWFRLIVTLTATAGSKFVFWGGSNNGSSVSYAGSTSISQTFYGYQLEASSYPTSYIPTTSSSATRVADACFKTGISSLIGQTSGVLFIDFYAKGSYDSNNLLMLISSGSGGEIIYLNLVSGTIEAYIAASSTQQFLYTSGTALATNTRHKLAIAYASNDIALYHNGTQLATDTSASIPACSLIRIGDFLGGLYQFGNTINEAVLFPTRLTNAELASLTTI